MRSLVSTLHKRLQASEALIGPGQNQDRNLFASLWIFLYRKIADGDEVGMGLGYRRCGVGGFGASVDAGLGKKNNVNRETEK